MICYQGRVIAKTEVEAMEKIWAKYPGAKVRIWMALVQPYKEASWFEYLAEI